jgi:hypothetical protein
LQIRLGIGLSSRARITLSAKTKLPVVNLGFRGMLMRAGVLDVGAGAALAVMAAEMGVAMVAEAVLRNRMVTHESVHLLTRI